MSGSGEGVYRVVTVISDGAILSVIFAFITWEIFSVFAMKE